MYFHRFVDSKWGRPFPDGQRCTRGRWGSIFSTSVRTSKATFVLFYLIWYFQLFQVRLAQVSCGIVAGFLIPSFIFTSFLFFIFASVSFSFVIFTVMFSLHHLHLLVVLHHIHHPSLFSLILPLPLTPSQSKFLPKNYRKTNDKTQKIHLARYEKCTFERKSIFLKI